MDRFENLMEAINIMNAKRMKALLLHLAGEQTYNIYDGLIVQAVAEDADPTVDNVYLANKRALDTHFSPKKNVSNLQFSSCEAACTRDDRRLSRMTVSTVEVL